MDKKLRRIVPELMVENEKYYERDLQMEACENIPRWSIPRPSLSSCSGSRGGKEGGGASAGAGSGEESVSSASHAACGSSRGGCRRGGCRSRDGGKHCRSSASSQGSYSNHSNHSTQSASSGSLLLSAANLAQVGTQNSPTRLSPSSLTNYQSNLSNYVDSVGKSSLYNEKLPQVEVTMEPDNSQNHSDPFWNHVKLASIKNQRRDLKDNESVASSTHFTVVNGFTRHGRSTKNEKQMWCCKSSHQITVLVVTMTIIFTAGILAAICYVEMRQRRDIGSRFS